MHKLKAAREAIESTLRERGYRDSTIEQHRRYWNILDQYLLDRGASKYTAQIGLDYLAEIHGITPFKKHDKEELRIIRAVQLVNDYFNHGVIFTSTAKKSYKDLLKYFGDVLTVFKTHQAERHGNCEITLKEYDKSLGKFLFFLEKNDVSEVSGITFSLVQQYTRVIAQQSTWTAHMSATHLRVFLRHQYETGRLSIDLSKDIPTFNFERKTKLPATLTNEEIHSLLECIDRSSPVGKRDYAIILLSCRLGLRAEDIRRMKFRDIHWDTNTIEIETNKTHQLLTLPILDDVGHAIIEYIKHGRPITDGSEIFQRHYAPIEPLGRSAITALIRKYAGKAAIDMNVKRPIGTNIMRHTLASALLKNNVPLPEISGILGHATTRTTQQYYLRIDTEQLHKCAINVPPFVWEIDDEEVL